MYLTVFLGGEYGNADVTELYNSKKRKWKIVNRKNGFPKLNGFSAVGFDENAYVFGGWDINELEVRNGLMLVTYLGDNLCMLASDLNIFVIIWFIYLLKLASGNSITKMSPTNRFG